jgi:acyl-CoA synthetase (AMP-forming)/AMP-acid ligase II
LLQPLNPDIDHDGWFRTGDMGFFDIFGNIYILERLTFMFKYVEINTKLMLPTVTWVSVCEIELVLQEHPAVLEAGVVGVAHPETSSAARAYIVLRPGRHMFSWEMQRYVAKILPSCKQLHGGVRFVKMLPVTRKGHLDREALQKMAISDSKHKKNLVISDE